MRVGAVILGGGRSTRMGVAKADLPFGDETMLARVARRLAEVASPIVVVSGHGRNSPHLTTPCRIAFDAHADRGPLEGLAAGLRAIGHDADAIFATTCDAPLVVPEFVRILADRLGACDAAIPWDGEFLHPLSAVYRVRVLPAIERMLAADRLRPMDLANEVTTVRVSVDDLRMVDARLDSLRNLNRPEDYLAALADAGFVAPAELLARLNRRT
jgi:molybdopterin-guanine dinucleotide biosynthesis protein A